MVTRAQMERLLRQLEGALQRVVERAVRNARSRAQVAAIEAAVVAGDVDAILLAAGYRDGMWSELTENIRNAYMQAGTFVVGADVPKRFGMEFNINNPRAQSWLRNHSSQLVTYITAEQKGAVQEIMAYGFSKGSNPRTIALDIVGRISKATGRRSGGVLGLTQNQARYVANASEDLLNLDPRYFDRKLRDRRYDRIVRQSFEQGTPLPQKMRETIIARYEDRMLKHRGDTIGRTEALSALNEASDEAMRQVVEEGLAPSNAVKRVWRHSFSANEREGHLMMNGQERGVDEAFTNPITGAVLKHPGEGPGSETINCRCYIEHKVDFVAVEKASAA